MTNKSIFIFYYFFIFINLVNASAIKKVAWPSYGILGKIDRQSAQRGFQVYQEICSSCHSLKYTNYRNLKNLGFSKQEIEKIIKSDIFRQNTTSKIVNSNNNKKIVLSQNNAPPDLSLIVKSNTHGGNYVYSVLTGYKEIEKNLNSSNELYYNSAFPNQQTAMPWPFYKKVKYIDNTETSVEQMAMDVTIFLQWASEPEMENRKSLGLKVMMFLIVMTILAIIIKKNIWKNIK